MDVFVYGTLVDPDRARAVLNDWTYVSDAVLDGLHRVEGTYPTLAPGGSVEGRLLRTEEVDRLDAYEGVDARLYVRVSVPSMEETGRPDASAEVYVGDPDRLDADAAWPGDGPFLGRARSYVTEHDVTVRRRQDRQG